MYKLEGPAISLRLKGKDGEVAIGKDGEVGYMEAGHSVKLAVTADQPDVWLADVDGQKNVVARKPDSDSGVYTTSIHLWESETSGVACTRYPENDVRVLRYLGDGVVGLWEIALISQDGKFWVTCQKSYEIAVASDGEQFLCPQFAAKWPQLVDVLEQLLEGKELPTEAVEFPTEELTAAGSLSDGHGVVKWWNRAQQMGAIITNKGDVRIHWSQVIADNGSRRGLYTGQSVSFKSLRRIEVREGQRPTGFKFEATGVKPVLKAA